MKLKINSLVIFVVLISESFEQEPSYKCDNAISTKTKSYYDRSRRYRCSFNHLKSYDDFKEKQMNFTSSYLVYTIKFFNSTISNFPDKMFNNHTKLKEIYASNISLSEIAPTVFTRLKSLDFLDLSNNKIKELKPNTFLAMRIESLDLSINYLETIDDTVFKNSEFININLSFNKLKSLKFLNTFGTFNTLELNDNLIESFSEYKFVLEEREKEHLIYYENDYHDISIFLNNNKIKKFECSTDLRLKSVTLIDNSELREVSLSKCNIQNVDVSNCVNLDKLTLSDNLSGLTAKNIKVENLEIPENASLKSLSFANSSIPSNSLERILKMENLTILDLSYINIGPLNVSTFARLKSLQFLILKATNISNIQFGTFSHQQSVQDLDISDNNLGYFDFHMMFSMSYLKFLDISGNDLSSIENIEAAHFSFSKLKTLIVSNNSWTCDYLLKIMKTAKELDFKLRVDIPEENRTNIKGIGCVHVEGVDNVMKPLSSDSNMTDIRLKLSEVVNEISKDSDFRTSIRMRVKQLEDKLSSNSKPENPPPEFYLERFQNIKVQNSALLDIFLMAACLCFVLFVIMKAYKFTKTNILNKRRVTRPLSEHTLTMTTDY